MKVIEFVELIIFHDANWQIWSDALRATTTKFNLLNYSISTSIATST